MWDLSSLTRGWTHVPYTGRQILNQGTTTEVPDLLVLLNVGIIFFSVPCSIFLEFLFGSFYFINSYCSIIALQCFVSFYCLAK